MLYFVVMPLQHSVVLLSRVKWLVELPMTSVKDICVVDGQEDKLEVSGEFLKKAMAGLGDEVSKVLSHCRKRL